MLPWYSPWLKISLALRLALTHPWDASAWAEVRQHNPVAAGRAEPHSQGRQVQL